MDTTSTPTNGRDLYSALVSQGFELSRSDNGNLAIDSDDPGLSFDAGFLQRVTEAKNEILSYVDAAKVLSDGAADAEQRGDTAAASRLWRCVQDYDPRNDGALDFFARISQSPGSRTPGGKTLAI